MPPVLEILQPQQITSAVIASIPQRNLFKELSENNFAGLFKIAESGNHELLKNAFKTLENYDPLRRRFNRFPLLGRAFKHMIPDAIRRAVSANTRYANFALFVSAIRSKNLDSIKAVLEVAKKSGILREMLASNEYRVFVDAASEGRRDIVDFILEGASPRLIKQIMQFHNYDAIRIVAYKGRLDILNRFLEISNRVEISHMLEADNFAALRSSAESGHLEVFNRLLEVATDEQIQRMIQTFNFSIFRSTAAKGHLAVLNRILELVPDPSQQQQMIAANFFEAFHRAAEGGYLDVINRILELVPDPVRKQQMIAATNFAAFRNAAKGHFDVVDKILTEVDPAQKQAMIAASNFQAFKNAAASGNLNIMRRLLAEVDPLQKQAMIRGVDNGIVSHFEAFSQAVLHGHFAAAKLLLEEVDPLQKQAMITASSFAAFRGANANKHTGLVVLLLHAIDPAQKQLMISSVGDALNSRVRNIIAFPNLLNAAANPNYKTSIDSFVLEVMGKTYRSICESLREDKTIPLTQENFATLLTPEQIKIAEVVTVKVENYIYENSAKIKSARDLAVAFSKEKLPSIKGNPSSLVSSIPGEIEIEIFEKILPNFIEAKPQDLVFPISPNHVGDLAKSNLAAKEILKSESLTARSIAESYVNRIVLISAVQQQSLDRESRESMV